MRPFISYLDYGILFTGIQTYNSIKHIVSIKQKIKIQKSNTLGISTEVINRCLDFMQEDLLEVENIILIIIA
jgi:hypothetical protein